MEPKKKTTKRKKTAKKARKKAAKKPTQTTSNEVPKIEMDEEMSGPGRPTDFRPEYTQMLIDYFSVPPYRIEKRITMPFKGIKMETEVEVANDIPTLAGFACELGVHRATLLDWTKRDASFLDAYRRAKEYQERYLAVNGNKGLIQSNFAQFTAKNLIDWREKQPGEEDKVIVNNLAGATDEELDARIQQLIEEINAEKKG